MKGLVPLYFSEIHLFTFLPRELGKQKHSLMHNPLLNDDFFIFNTFVFV